MLEVISNPYAIYISGYQYERQLVCFDHEIEEAEGKQY
jgi:hypothetical protein